MGFMSHLFYPTEEPRYPPNRRLIWPRLVWTVWRREKYLVAAGIWTLDNPACSPVTVLTVESWLTEYGTNPLFFYITNGAIDTSGLLIHHMYFSWRISWDWWLLYFNSVVELPGCCSVVLCIHSDHGSGAEQGKRQCIPKCCQQQFHCRQQGVSWPSTIYSRPCT